MGIFLLTKWSFPCGRRLFWAGQHGKIVRAERRSGQVSLVPEVAGWKIRPAVAHGHRLRHIRASDDYLIILNIRFSIYEFVIGAGDRKACQLASLGDQAAAKMIEAEMKIG